MAARAWVKAAGLSWNGSPEPWGSCLDRGGVWPWSPLALASVLARALVLALDWSAPRKASGSQSGSFRISFRASPRTAAKLLVGCRAQAMASQTRTKRPNGPPPRVTPARVAACSMTARVNQGANARKSRCRILSHTICLLGSTNIGGPSLISCLSLNNLCQGVLLDFNPSLPPLGNAHHPKPQCGKEIRMMGDAHPTRKGLLLPPDTPHVPFSFICVHR